MSKIVKEVVSSKVLPIISSTIVPNANSVAGIFQLLLITSFLTLVIWYVQFSWSRRELYRKAGKIPDYNAIKLPFIGIAHYMLGNTENLMYKLIHFCAKGTPVMGWLGFDPICLIHKPEDIEIVMNSPKALGRHHLYRFGKYIGGNGLFTAPVSIWKVNRKIMMPTFNQKILNQFFEAFSSQSEILLEILKSDVGKCIDMNDKLSNWSMDTICKTAMGVNLSAQTTHSTLLSHLHRSFEVMFHRCTKILYQNDFIFSLTSMAKTEKLAVSSVNTFVNRILREKHKEIENKRLTIYEKPEAEITDEKQMVAFLDLFMDRRYTEKQLTDEELSDEIKTILITGSDTSATALGFIFLMLAIYPEIQRKTYDEVVDICGLNRHVLLDDLPKFKYMERVIKETLRLFPLGPFIFRNVTDDLDMTKYTLPKGSGVGIATIVLHRSPEYYKDPLKFDPDRFLPEEVAKRHPYAFIPFSAGPRNCIGMKYAMMSMKTLIATLIRKYQIETHYKDVTEVRFRQDMLIKPVSGFPMTFNIRND